MTHVKNTLPAGFRSRFEEKPPDGSAQGGNGAAGAGLDEKKVHEIVNSALQRALPGVLKPMQDQFTQLTETLAKLTENPSPRKDEGGEGKGKDKSELPPEINARIKELETQRKADAAKLEKLENDRKEAEARALATDKESKIRAVLGQFNFTSPEAADDAFTLLNGLVQRTESGELVGGDNLPYDVFIKDYVPAKKRYLLAEVGKGGSGASGGAARGAAGAMDISAIRPGMSKDDMARAAAAIRQALPAGN